MEEPAYQFVEVEYRVEPNYAGWRLDRYLCEKIRRLSRTRVQRIIENELVGERKLKPSSLVTAGMTFRLRRRVLEEPDTPDHAREVFQDEHLLILDKPAGLPMHPTARYHTGTLVGVIARVYGDRFRADPAHRLDRETSGLVVCGKTADACRKLGEAFVEGAVKKEYLAICEGTPPNDAFEVDAPIAEGTAEIRIAVRIDAKEGKAAQTAFRVERRFEREGEPFALIRCLPRTGRQHQIRIHLQTQGLPLVGDKMYGPDPGYFDRFSKRALEEDAWLRLRLPRHALHAARLSFAHPATGAWVEFTSPLPEDLQSFCDGKPLRGPLGLLPK